MWSSVWSWLSESLGLSGTTSYVGAVSSEYLWEVV